MSKVKHKERILKTGKETPNLIRLTASFQENTEIKWQWNDILKVLKGKDSQPRIPYPGKLSLKSEG